ncbi:MAG: hypothetical protein ABSA91_11625 [Acidimicrobiales bacterium]|jgi:hypothetical protein
MPTSRVEGSGNLHDVNIVWQIDRAPQLIAALSAIVPRAWSSATK